MQRPTKISTIMYILLVEEKMDSFSVIEARDTLLQHGGFNSDTVELRKMVYRQILYFERKRWLKGEGEGRHKIYYVTDDFKQRSIINTSTLIKQCKTEVVSDDYSILLKERREYEGELKIVLGEIDEYRSLQSRFPKLEQKITPLLQDSKIRSAELLGKVNVLTNILKCLSTENIAC